MKHYQITANKVLSPDEYSHLERLLKRSVKDVKSRRDALAILLIMATGMRSKELSQFKTSDLIVNAWSKECTVHIRSVKGSNNRDIPIRWPFAKHIVAYILSTTGKLDLSAVDPEFRPFGVSTCRLRGIWNWYRPNRKKGLHSLRHTFAVRLYQSCKDIHLVKTALGHRQISNTMVYLDFVYSSDRLKKALLAV